NSQLAKRDEGSQGTHVFGLIGGILLCILAGWIILFLPWQRTVHQRAVRANNGDPHSSEGENISRLRSHSLVLSRCQQFLIPLPTLYRRRIRTFAVIAVIDERS